MRRHRVIATAVMVAGVLGGSRESQAHLNSPDLFHEGMAGPYKMLVTIRPPDVIPGVATIEVLASSPELRQVTLVPLPMRGPGAISPPVADVAVRDPADARRFQGRLWLMASGSWQVRVHAEGPDGAGDLAVPVAALAMRTKTMQAGLGVVLLALLAFLFAGMVSIIGASVRDADLAEGTAPDPHRRRRARKAQAVTALVLAAAIAGGFSWWGDEASFYGRLVYKPIALAATMNDGGAAGARELDLTLTDPGWLPSRKLDDLLPDHGHLMHLFVVRVPGLDALAHLHPAEISPGRFTQRLPALPAGDYQLFADIVHANGLGETATTQIAIAAGADSAPAGDDAVGTGAPIIATANGTPGGANPVATLADGTRVTWLRDRDAAATGTVAPLIAGRPSWFRFRVGDRDGSPARDVVPYMGMAGHAVFMSHDRAVFAHVHPTGSVPMAALALVADKASGGGDPHAGHHMAPDPLPPEIAFPYACPRAGDYRIFVQFRRGDVIETAIFDAAVR